MGNPNCILSPVTRRRLETQGYVGFTDAELNNFKFGIRFAFYACGLLVLSGLIFSKVEILLVAMGVAFLAALSPSHPFDYIYNYGVRQLLGKPRMPARSNQGRFACGIATFWLAGVIFLLKANLHVWAYIAGAILLTGAVLVSTLDICIPSMIYNFLFKRQTSERHS
jgi:hypothetical protein